MTSSYPSLKDESYTEVVAVLVTCQVVVDYTASLPWEKMLESSNHVSTQNHSKNTDTPIINVQHPIQYTFNSVKTNKNQGNKIQVSLQGAKIMVKLWKVKTVLLLSFLLCIGVQIWESQSIQMMISSGTLWRHFRIDFFCDRPVKNLLLWIFVLGCSS